MRYVLLCFLISLTMSVSAQTTYTEHLKKNSGGKGAVTIVQDAEIEALVNNVSSEVQKEKKEAPSVKGGEKTRQPHSSTETTEKTKAPRGARQRYKAQGYRIQIYTGGNSRADRLEAERMEKKCQKEFPELSTYVHFVSPRWICRVGDFRSQADAEKYLRLIRNSRISHEARIVKCAVLLAY